MSLPEILAPAGVPEFANASHTAEPKTVYANVERGSGATRARRLRRSAPQIRNIVWHLNAAQMAIVEDWYRNVLLEGERDWSARVPDFGPLRLWYRVNFLDEPKKSPLGMGRWRVTFPLLLIGPGEVDPPVLSSLEMEILVPLTGRAVLIAEPFLNMEISVPLTGAISLNMEILVPLEVGTPIPSDGRITEDGIVRHTETGITRITE